MALIIDSREHSLISTLRSQEPDISFSVKTLDLADIEYLGVKGQRFLFERKTIKDLASSLNDGRFKDQKDRLLGVLEREPQTAIAYILEGSMKGGENDIIQGRIRLGMVRSLLYTIQLRYRIPIIYTNGIQDTATWVRRFHRHLGKKPDFMPVGCGSNAGCSSYKTLLPAPIQNRAKDTESITIAMLTSISGVSHTIGSAIVRDICRLGQSSNFFHIIRTYTREDFASMLESVKISGRKLSKKIREVVCELFYEPNQILVQSQVACQEETS